MSILLIVLSYLTMLWNRLFIDLVVITILVMVVWFGIGTVGLSWVGHGLEPIPEF